MESFDCQAVPGWPGRIQIFDGRSCTRYFGHFKSTFLFLQKPEKFKNEKTKAKAKQCFDDLPEKFGATTFL